MHYKTHLTWGTSARSVHIVEFQRSHILHERTQELSGARILVVAQTSRMVVFIYERGDPMLLVMYSPSSESSVPAVDDVHNFPCSTRPIAINLFYSIKIYVDKTQMASNIIKSPIFNLSDSVTNHRPTDFRWKSLTAPHAAAKPKEGPWWCKCNLTFHIYNLSFFL